jgi:type I restriction enzyme S subunit
VPLGDLVAAAEVRRAGTVVLPVLSMTMHGGLVDQSAKFKKRVASADTSSYKVIRRGQLVVGFPIDEGVLDFQSIYEEAIVSPAYGVWDLRDDTKTDRDYLRRFLRSPLAMAYYKAKLRGSTARRRSLPTAVFMDLPVPHPSIDEQRGIAAILDHAEALRTKQRSVITQLDDLTRAVFAAMFNASPLRPRWPTVRLGDVVPTIDSGSSPVCENRRALNGEWGVLKLGAISYGVFNPSENKAFLGDPASLRKVEVQPHDLLFSRKNTKELVGATAIAYEPPALLLLPDLIFRLNLDRDRIDAEYLHALLQSPRTRPAVVALASGSASSMSNISKGRLLELPIELPPIDLQHAYSDRVITVNSARDQVSRAIVELDELFASLQSRAFSGQL